MIYQKISNLRNLYKNYDINGYIVPNTDEYLNEYVQDYAKRLEYITGFTGSSGIAVIFLEETWFFTDGRYLQQASKELDTILFKIFNISEFVIRLKEYASYNNFKIGYDPKLFSLKFLNNFKEIKLESIENNLIDIIWQDQPKVIESNPYIYPIEFAGKEYHEKLGLCRNELIKNNAEYIVITDPASVCWILNIRAQDIEYSPLLLSNLVITHNNYYLFANIINLEQKLKEARDELIILPTAELPIFLSEIQDKILIDTEIANSFIVNSILHPQHFPDPTILARACKNSVEINAAVDAHIHDAVAVCKFLSYINKLSLGVYSEYDLGEILTSFRQKHSLYVTDSFATICGFKENGSIIHYQATKNDAKKIQGDGILLIDSGAQYMGCTTDVTRTIAIGEVSKEQKEFYTRILKGHIALTNIKFPAGTAGSHLDVLARQYLWEQTADYAHGTGHGVGSFLNVHEGPHNINRINKIPLLPGMILSNEPGYYKAGSYGIRIENLMYVASVEETDYLKFINLTLIPYEKKLINFDLLTLSEIEFIKNYYSEISLKVAPLLDREARSWLEDTLNINL